MSIFIFLILGIFVGILSGMLGVGGGIVMVPIIYFFLEEIVKFPDALTMKLSLGTSFAAMIFTSLSSIYSHNKKGFIQWDFLKCFSISIILGVFLGGLMVSILSTKALKYIFSIFILFSIVKMMTEKKNTDLKQEKIKPLNNRLLSFFGLLIGFISALVGIGGGSMTVPFMNALGYNLRKSIATSAVVGFPIAVIGTLTALFTGWSQTSFHEHSSIGYIYIPAFIGIIPTSMLFAPVGAKLTHTLPTIYIKIIFCFFLAAMLLKMLFS